MLFSKPVSAVAFWAHGFFAYQTTTLAAFSIDGTLIGETRNDAPFNPYSNVGNAQWIGFKDPEGKNSISGLTYFSNAPYSAAMAPAISSFKFGSAVDLVSPHTPPFTPVPEPTTYALGGLVMIFVGIVVRTKRLRAV